MFLENKKTSREDADCYAVFFQGKYVDHNHDDETMGFAQLIDL
jgi:hypothetical protein